MNNNCLFCGSKFSAENDFFKQLSQNRNDPLFLLYVEIRQPSSQFR
jgi:hypothetical protein